MDTLGFILLNLIGIICSLILSLMAVYGISNYARKGFIINFTLMAMITFLPWYYAYKDLI